MLDTRFSNRAEYIFRNSDISVRKAVAAEIDYARRNPERIKPCPSRPESYLRAEFPGEDIIIYVRYEPLNKFLYILTLGEESSMTIDI